MKRMIFLILLAILGVIKVSAQEVDMSQENSADTRIEELTQEVAELSERLDKLQEDYNFLSLEKFVEKIKALSKAVEVLIRRINPRRNVMYPVQ